MARRQTEIMKGTLDLLVLKTLALELAAEKKNWALSVKERRR